MPSSQEQELEDLYNDPAYTKKKFQLADGRYLSYSEAGDILGGRTTQQQVALYQFGLMASSLAVIQYHHQALKLRVRIIAIDYPGIGETTYSSSSNGNDNDDDDDDRQWAQDVYEFCNKMLGKHVQLSIVAHSLGAPRALALLHHSKLQKRIRTVVFVSPWILLRKNHHNSNKKTAEKSWLLNTILRMPPWFQEKVFPFALTSLLTTNDLLSNQCCGACTCSKSIAKKVIHGYARVQGQRGNRQMVKLSLVETTLPTLTYAPSIKLHIFHGKKDVVVPEDTCKLLVEYWKDLGHEPTFFHSIDEADHWTIMNGHVSSILETVTEEWS